MLAGIFVVSGAKGLGDPDRLVPTARDVTDRVGPALQRIHPGLPSDARTLVQLDQAAKLAGGLLLLTPLRRPASLVLAGLLAPATLAAHRFWGLDDPALRAQQQTQFLKNLGLIGGLLLAAADTEGRPGLRWRTAHMISDANRSLHREAKNTRAKVRLASRAGSIGRRLPG
jgi:putative oxidoreductase